MKSLDTLTNFGSIGAVLAFVLWVGYSKILPLWKDTVIALQKAIEALEEHLQWMRVKNGKS